MAAILRCVYNIPICGGFCAPTDSPEKSWLRHFSNEYTLPLAGVFMKMKGCLEINACCRRCGSTGIAWSEKNRRRLMIVSFWISFIAWLLNFYAAGALFMHPAVLKATAWSKGVIASEQHHARAHIWVGLHGRVDEVDCSGSDSKERCEALLEQYPNLKEIRDGVYQRVVGFSEERSCIKFAIKPQHKQVVERWAPNYLNRTAAMCEGCRDSASASVTFVIMGLITQIPQMTTDLQRATRFGDVNCQATMGCVTSFWGVFSGLKSLLSFSQSCWKKFPDGFDGADGERVDIHMTMGPGYVCLLIATVMKLWDAFAHLSLPTPRERQDPPPKDVENLLDYMMMAVDDEDSNSDASEDDSESGRSD